MWLLWMLIILWLCGWVRYWWRHWKTLGITCVAPWTATYLILGGKRSYTETLKELYYSHPQEPFLGLWILSAPVLLARDPHFIWRIMSKDFNKFCDKGLHDPLRLDRLNGNIINADGETWSYLRKKMGGFISRNKLAEVEPLIISMSKNLATELQGKNRVDIMHVSDQFLLDITTKLMFSENEEIEQIKDVVRETFKPSLLINFRSVLRYLFPSVLVALQWKRFSQETEDCFDRAIKRRLNVESNDFVQDLINIFMTEEPKNMIDTVAGNVYGLMTAAVETTSTALGFALYELAKRPDIQERVASGTEESLITNIVSETLRLYPIAQITSRIAGESVEAYGRHVPRNTRITIPLAMLHRDATYFPDPEVFRPERFASNPTWPQGAYMPFGGGPRKCLGYRLANLVLEKAISSLVTEFEFSLNADTMLPLKFKPNSLMITPASPIYLNIKLRTST